MSPPSRRHLLQWAGSVVAVPGITTGTNSRSKGTSNSNAVAWKQTYGDSELQCQAIGDANDGVLVVGRTGSSRSATAWLAEIGPRRYRSMDEDRRYAGFHQSCRCRSR